MGGKSAAPQNNQMVQFEMQQAQEARAKEERRKQRLDAGTQDIAERFYGTPVYESKIPASVINFTPTAGASGDTYLSSDAQENNPGEWYGGDLQKIGDTGYGWRGVDFTAGKGLKNSQYASQIPASGFELWGPDNQLIGRGTDWSALTSGFRTDTGKRVARPGEKIFDDQFFNDYNQKQLDYYMPQLDDPVTGQFPRAIARTNFALSDAGLGVSSAGVDALSQINQQNADARAGVINSADRATGDLRESISSQYKQALAQLQAQEDPDVAATGAIGSVNNMLQAVPQLTPLGDLFKPLVIGAGSAYNSFNDASGYNSGFRNVFQSSGKVSQGG